MDYNIKGEIIQGVPKGEKVWVSIYDGDNIIYLIASNKLRQDYKLYKIDNGRAVYTQHKSSNPLELEKFVWA